MKRLRFPRNPHSRRSTSRCDRWLGAQRAAAWTLVSSFALGACVQPDAPGLAVKALPANLVFGAAAVAAPQPAAPANSVVNVPVALPPLPPLPPPPPLTIAPPPFQPPPLPPALECPEAGINVFPEEVAARNVAEDRRPPVGAYRWQREGTQQGTHTASFEIPIGGFEQRSLRNVQPLAGSVTDFTFEQHQKDLITNETVVTTFQVRTAGTSISQDTLGVQPIPDAPEIPSIGEPDRGVTIVRIQRSDKDGNEISSWEALAGTGVLLLPLPVRVNEEWQSQAVDPTSFGTITYNGKVNPVERIDACGEVVEGWLVTGNMVIQTDSKTAERSTYDLVFVPQMGGVPVYEHIVETTTQGPVTATLDVEYTIGQLEPDTLEEESA